MKRQANHKKYLELREQFPFFEYQSYSFQINNQNLNAEFVFNISDKYLFKPTITIPAREFYRFENLEKKDLDVFVFNIGMVELISYWKSACPPKVIVRPFRLDEDQVRWWKKLYFNGLGEFFYLNGISAGLPDFMEMTAEGSNAHKSSLPVKGESVIVPIGGGKDSVVTLELLKLGGADIYPMVVNPREASIRTIDEAGLKPDKSIVVERKLDKLLLELNKQGFLNGHTPFSALLAFVSVLTAAISGIKNIALSNESSANESTVPGTDINHQYSKSIEFEEDFNWYLKKYIHPEIKYFSFLRPVNELQIAKLFSGFPNHFNSFRSCNVGSKTDSWCGKCPKCLFTFIILSPFIKRYDLENIFGKNLFEDKSLLAVFEELTGASEVKPFECVGTPDEVKAALWQTLKISDFAAQTFLLKHFIEQFGDKDSSGDFKLLLEQFDEKNFIPNKFLPILKNALRK